MSRVKIYTRRQVAKSIQQQIDPLADWVVYLNRKPVAELSFLDGQYWSRPFAAPRTVPFRPYCARDWTLKMIADEYWGD